MFENPDMLGNRSQRHGQRFGEFVAHRTLAGRERHMDRSSRRIGEGVRNPVECMSVSLNHIVELYKARKWVKRRWPGKMPDLVIPPSAILQIQWRTLERFRLIIVGLMPGGAQALFIRARI
ncbi:hypothetical protein [Hyphomicrobium sp.]|uniref:hypothetical protein n=1 Tax=Hyphomicrobium sp. TaxID=82 RepID=UPI0025C07CA8|nr:hypothetical protein [Hyphomicrobium sp.]